MATLNKRIVSKPLRTAEGAPADRISDTKLLARLVNACMLWEDNFYLDGTSVADLIASLVAKVLPESAQTIAIKARTEQKLRHVPLLVAREMARASKAHRELVADTLCQIIQRPDELTEFLAIYWKDGKQPLSAQVKKGLARAFTKFNAFSLAKYNRDGAVKLRDVAFLTHVKPAINLTRGRQGVNGLDSRTLAQLVNKDHFPKKSYLNKAGTFSKLEIPDTWEVALSGGADKGEAFTRLLEENKLGALALLRNLRNMINAGVDNDLIREAILSAKTERVLPFRFISAAKYGPQFEPELEAAMFKCVADHDKLEGQTVLLVDVSGSMEHTVSDKSELTRLDAAKGLAMLLREVCEDVIVETFSDSGALLVPSRRGFALGEAIENSQSHGGTDLGRALQQSLTRYPKADRIIVISDEQSRTPIKLFGNAQAYMLNVASERNGVSYGNGWRHVDGWSEACVNYILAEERDEEDED